MSVKFEGYLIVLVIQTQGERFTRIKCQPLGFIAIKNQYFSAGKFFVEYLNL